MFKITAFLALSTLFAGGAFAQSPAAQAQAAQTLSSAQADAAQLVDAFVASLVAEQFDAARQFLAPGAVVVANGQVLGDRDGYIDGAAHGDATALRSVQRELVRREIHAGREFASVVSEKRMRAPGDAKGPSEAVIETMVLARTPNGWKITHIHWSGRHAG
jgi:ketosteroid isomerase-like protein